MPVSAVQAAKRAFVSVILYLANEFGVSAQLTRDSDDKRVLSAYKKVCLKVHPDKGGRAEAFKQLVAAKEKWEAASAKKGQKKQTATVPELTNANGSIFRINSTAVLLTYQGITGLDDWDEFLDFVSAKLKQWGVLRWCATMETTKKGNLHIHLMLQFRTTIDRPSRSFAFKGKPPNAGPNGPGKDYCGEGYCRKKIQESIDRGMFYVFADKIGTCRNREGNPCVSANYYPAWIPDADATYRVKGQWPEVLWKQYKLSHDACEDYLFKCRDNVLSKKRNLDACRQREEALEEEKEIAEVAKRIKANPSLYQPFGDVPAATAWLKLFSVDAMRYPVLIVLGPSGTGKTEWAQSLFENPLVLKVGSLTHFPEGMRQFSRKKNDALILDDIRDMKFLTDHQDKLQGKYNARVEFASTPGGTCAYQKYLYACPIVVTVNYTTVNLSLLSTCDWLGKDLNRVVVEFGAQA